MPAITLPKATREAVIRELYRQVGSLDWEDISTRERTAYYTQWVEDELIGGELADYYTAEGMRVWLKDGPLKEYARALENFGSYAEYATKRLSPADEFITEILGDAWEIKPNSIREKPMHCLVTDGKHERYVCWGRARTFRDLLWAAVNKAVTTPSKPLMVVYVTDDTTIQERQKRQHELIAKHCSLDLAYVRRRLEAAPQE
ncbi:hypothetical protein CFP71_00305 [Amycolatopsis thailandensis]|uniref:Uncharacterized protein n=1 Tax=Amycolatopsis thailandensis TaxID=589330 RepID=A0A229SJA8_9PSEU|nr:hypothetical protein [Amycolatopsis thailandensis]OXM58960.1 hypothetical protein CFP71_00305 [Amycolatopsis thailandensis]